VWVVGRVGVVPKGCLWGCLVGGGGGKEGGRVLREGEEREERSE